MNTDNNKADSPVRVLVSGYLGKMGTEVCRAVSAAPDMILVGGYDPVSKQEMVLVEGEQAAPAFTDLSVALEEAQPQVMVDFTLPAVAAGNLQAALTAGVVILDK